MAQYKVLVPIRWKGKRHNPGAIITLTDLEFKSINSTMYLVEPITPEPIKTPEPKVEVTVEKTAPARRSTKKKNNNNN